MIARTWHGWTTPENADVYEHILYTEVIPGIKALEVPGFLGIEVFRRNLGAEVEFMTLMRFVSREAIRAFTGEDPERAHVPDVARRVLKRFEERARHYEVRPRP